MLRCNKAARKWRSGALDQGHTAGARGVGRYRSLQDPIAPYRKAEQMTSMTEKELAALESAKRAPIQFEFEPIKADDLHAMMRDAQTLRSKFIAQQVSRLWRQLRAALGLDQRAEQAATRRLYKETVRELSRLDERELNDLGIGRGQIHAAARRAVGLPESEEPGIFARLRLSIADARDRRRTARQLAALDDRMLYDIGINRGDIHSYLRGEKDLSKGHPAMQMAAPTVAVDLLFPQPTNLGWNGTPEAANTAEEEARAA